MRSRIILAFIGACVGLLLGGGTGVVVGGGGGMPGVYLFTALGALVGFFAAPDTAKIVTWLKRWR